MDRVKAYINIYEDALVYSRIGEEHYDFFSHNEKPVDAS